MFAFFITFLLFFFGAAGTSSGGGFTEWWHKNAEPIASFPGFELWRFLNLTIFLAIIIKLIKTPLSNAFKAKREEIRADLIKAEEERQLALNQLTEAEVKLSRLDEEKKAVQERAKLEANNEENRIIEETKTDITRMREQTVNEINRLGQQTKHELRKFSAEESVKLAEEIIKKGINEKTDIKLVKSATQAMGGAN